MREKAFKITVTNKWVKLVLVFTNRLIPTILLDLNKKVELSTLTIQRFIIQIINKVDNVLKFKTEASFKLCYTSVVCWKNNPLIFSQLGSLYCVTCTRS